MAMSIIAFAVLAFPVVFFHGWDVVIQQSTDIVIARCKSTPGGIRYTNGMEIINPSGGLVTSDIEPVFILKGKDLMLGAPATLVSKYWPRQKEDYLIFGDYHDGYCQALEEYRIVPLGLNFPTNMLTGQTLDQQIQTLLKYRLDNLNREIQKDQEEKQRLEEGIKK